MAEADHFRCHSLSPWEVSVSGSSPSLCAYIVLSSKVHWNVNTQKRNLIFYECMEFKENWVNRIIIHPAFQVISCLPQNVIELESLEEINGN